MKPIVLKLSALVVSMLPLAALAGAPTSSNTVPEPATWGLIALAGAVGAAIARNKRK